MLTRQGDDIFSLRNLQAKKLKPRFEQLAEGLEVKGHTEQAVCRGCEAVKAVNEQKL